LQNAGDSEGLSQCKPLFIMPHFTDSRSAANGKKIPGGDFDEQSALLLHR
jgi:hypothetical protein